jgi:murein DD-endopeptidase MepM/ murein hydrolase activator NlpD
LKHTWSGIRIYSNVKESVGDRENFDMRGVSVRRRRSALTLSATLVLAVLLLVVPSSKVTADQVSEKRAQAREVERKLAALRGELNALSAELNRLQSQLALLERDISITEAELREQEAEFERWQGILADRVRAMYKQGYVTTLELFLGCGDFDTFINSFQYMSRIGSHDAEIMNNTRNLAGKIREKRNRLAANREAYRKDLESLARKREAVQLKLNEQKAILAGLSSDIASLLSPRYASYARGGGTASVGPVNGLYFPVAGPCSYTNDWGAPRSGGRTHKGCDIMAPRGTPVVAITSGVVEHRRGGKAGLYIALHGDNGHLYYYMHLDGFAASGRVRAGQVIGYVGDTGNARGCPHLHFEFHPNHRGPVNPYPLLRAIDR